MQIDSKYAVGSDSEEILEANKGNYFVMISTAGPASSVYFTQISDKGTLEGCLWGPEDLGFLKYARDSPEEFIKPPETNPCGFRAQTRSAAERFILTEEQIKKEGKPLVTLLDAYNREKKQVQVNNSHSSIVKTDTPEPYKYRRSRQL